MQALFPFGFPGPTALYLTLYVLTLGVHAVLMSYVLAGSGYVAAIAVLRRDRDPAARVLVDWLPAALGTAITAGVAPLLFLQILYKERFYTANLLLFHRWMAMVPVLIAGFYLLYLAKSHTVQAWARPWRAAVSLAAFTCFAFTAWSWTGNHLLALDQTAWTSLYASGATPRPDSELLVRLGLWLGGATPIMAVIVGWQLRHARRADSSAGADKATDTGADTAARRLAVVALLGLAASVACGLVYIRLLDADTLTALTGPLAGPYLALVALGLAVQAAAWAWHLARGRWSRAALSAAGAGAALAVVGTGVVREAMRLARMDIEPLLPAHARAANAGGMAVFLLFLAANAAIITWAVIMTRRGLRAAGRP